MEVLSFIVAEIMGMFDGKCRVNIADSNESNLLIIMEPLLQMPSLYDTAVAKKQISIL